MRSYLVAVFTVALTAAVAIPRSASAGSAVGTWQSDSGNTFIIPDSKTDFDVINKRPDGSQSVYHGRWVNGMVGTQFVYRDPRVPSNPACTATINRNNEDIIHVDCGGEPNTWTRVAIQHGRPGGVVGTWRSTSGFHFAIPKFGRDTFDILMTAPDGKKTLFQARWIENMVGTQFIMGEYTCTFDGQDPDVIRVVSSADKFIWQRE